MRCPNRNKSLDVEEKRIIFSRKNLVRTGRLVGHLVKVRKYYKKILY